MNILFLSYKEQLILLKSAYFDALASYNECYTEEALSIVCSSEDAYMSFIECTVASSF